MYKVTYLDYGNREIVRLFNTEYIATQYAKRINEIMNIQVSVIKVSEELVLSLLPRS